VTLTRPTALRTDPPPTDSERPAPGTDPVPERGEPILRLPPATGWLIATNVAVHVARLLLPDGLDEQVVEALGFDPASLRQSPDAGILLTLLTYQFLHGSWAHLGINMASLLAFGPGIERPLGPARFIGLYLVCGVMGGLTQAVVMPASAGDLLIGASAGISGLFGALLILWGFHRRGKRPLGILPLALLWIGVMAATGIAGAGAEGAPVAWIAHIGGFVSGMLLARPLAAGLRRR
jgi:membrane associated rhomboid family serine protease